MAGQSADVAGEWTLSFTISMRQTRTVEGTLTLEVDGNSLSGTFQRAGADTSAAVTGTLEGSTINFAMTGMGGRPGGGGGGGRPPGGGRRGGMQITFEGTVDGDSMSGQYQVGDRASGDWSAERAG